MRNTRLIWLAMCVLGSSWAAEPGVLKALKVWETKAVFRQPESVVYDAKRGVVYVSNIEGEETAKDGKGFISRLALDGEIQNLQWVQGLNAPKGMAIWDDRLYVADIDSLVEIDLAQAKITQRKEAPGAKFLNDVTVDAKGNVYISDTMTNTIYRFHEGKVEVWLHHPALEAPNGLLVSGDQLYEGAWGTLTEGLKTTVPGRIKTISLMDKSIRDFGASQPIGHMDGVELLADGSVLATDWMAGTLVVVSPSGEVQRLVDLAQGAADHEYITEKELVLIPMMNQGIVIAYRLSKN